MISKHFILEEHAEYGSIGLRPLDMPHADPLGGMAVAHDLLEHFPGDDGGVEAELQALGASLYVRDLDHYYLQRPSHRSDAAENIASDFPELWNHVWEGFSLEVPAKGRRGLECYEAEDAIQRAVAKGCRYIYDSNGETVSAESRKAMIRWMRIGYRRAQRRFKGVMRDELVWMFTEIERRAQRVIDQCGKMFQEGETIRVTVDIRRCNVLLWSHGLDSEDGY